MSTLNHEKDSTSLTIKRVILHNTDDHSELHEGNTHNTTKRLSLKRCMYDPRLILSYNLEVSNTYSYDDVRLNSRSTVVVVNYSTYSQTKIKHIDTKTSINVRASYPCTWSSFRPFKWCALCALPIHVILTLTHNCNQIYFIYLNCSTLYSKTLKFAHPADYC